MTHVLPAVLLIPVAIVGFGWWATSVPPIALLILPVSWWLVTWARYGIAEAALMKAVESGTRPGATRAEKAVASAHLVEHVEKRRLDADTAVWIGLATFPVIFVLCLPWGSGFAIAALVTAPAIPLGWWVNRRRVHEGRRIERDARTRSTHTEALAHSHVDGPVGSPPTAGPPAGPPTVPSTGWAPTTDPSGSAPPHAAGGTQGAAPAAPVGPTDLPVLVGTIANQPFSGFGIEARHANALVCHDLGLYLVEATFPVRDLQRSDLEPEESRRAVLAQAASGELWRPERIHRSVAWSDLLGWSIDKWTLFLHPSSGPPVHWRWRVPLSGGRAAAELDAQVQSVSDALTARIGPPRPA